MKKLSLSLFLLAFIFAGNLKAQELEETLTKLSGDAVSSYVAPLISAFGSNLNSGWVNGSPSSKLMGVDVEIKFVGIGSFFSDDAKTFNAAGSFRFTESQVELILNNSGYTSASPGYTAMKNEMLLKEFGVKISGATVVGKKDDHIKIEFPGQKINGQDVGKYELDLGVGGVAADLPLLPSGAIQLGLGTVYGTTLGIRYLPSIDIPDIGKFSYWGLGAMHNPAGYLSQMDMIPVDLSAAFFYQNLTIGDLFESSATQFGVYASKTFGAGVSVTPYLGLTMESSTTTVSYNYEFDTPAGPQKSKLALELEGENAFGVTIGSKFSFGFFNLFVDYKMASTSTVAGGMSFAF